MRETQREHFSATLRNAAPTSRYSALSFHDERIDTQRIASDGQSIESMQLSHPVAGELAPETGQRLRQLIIVSARP